ncbi:hypothetical protein J7J81_03025 [bacterium]|nr:hypothetical protein [bacterium]
MELAERQKLILKELIKEHIKCAQPISSQVLSCKSQFKISSATLRIEMQKLTESGYLYQPYTSGGRIPTDKGYRFFVDMILNERYERRFISKKKKEITRICSHLKKLNNLLRLSREITRTLAHLSSSLAITYLPKMKVIWREGWENIVVQPEFQDAEHLRDFIEVVNEFECNIKKFNLAKGELKIYIGKEVPLPKKGFTIIVTKSFLSKKSEGTLALLGPKRMNFTKNISLMNYFTEILEKV